MELKNGSKAHPAKLAPGVVSKLVKAADEVLPSAWELARSIHQRPETAYRERFASAAIIGFLNGRGFESQAGVAGIETAFVARRARGAARPAIGFLAEMDALPGMGHACGHHLIAASSAGAAAAMARALPEIRGAIEVIGCPAEEKGGGKLALSDAGAFDHLDAAVIAHPDQRTEVYKRSLGAVEIELNFFGRAAHAAAFPEQGTNALDAAIGTFNAVSVMRQQLPDKVRVHGIITHGGVAPNIIPDRAAALFMARGLTAAETFAVADKVVACARGAARAAGARLRARVDRAGMYAPYIPNRALGEVYEWALARLGVDIDQGPEDEGMGSTDVGAASLRAPMIHPLVGVPGASEGVHTRAFARESGAEPGRRMLEAAIKAGAITGAAALLDKDLRRRARREFMAMKKRMEGG